MYMNGWSGFPGGVRVLGAPSPSGPANGFRGAAMRPGMGRGMQMPMGGFSKGIQPASGLTYFQPRPQGPQFDVMPPQQPQPQFDQGAVYNPTGVTPIQAVDPMSDPNPIGTPQQMQTPWNDQQLLQQMYLGNPWMPQFGMGRPQFHGMGR